MSREEDAVDWGDAARCSVAAELFSKYAEEDAERWRVLVGGEAVHVDRRWGVGHVEGVRFGGGAGASPILRVHVRFPSHGTVSYRASSFARHHRTVSVPADVRRLIRDVWERPCDPRQRDRLLLAHSRALRDDRDRRRLERAASMRRAALERRPHQRD